MKSIILYHSIHHGNTKRIAEVFSKILRSEIVDIQKPFSLNIEDYDLIGLGSGIYFLKHSQHLLNCVQKWPEVTSKKTFIFSTRGAGSYIKHHRALRKILHDKGFQIIDEFSCKGFDSVGPLKLIGGINRGRPDEKDLKRAEYFAIKLLSDLKDVK